jgi:hypothetical protein
MQVTYGGSGQGARSYVIGNIVEYQYHRLKLMYEKYGDKFVKYLFPQTKDAKRHEVHAIRKSSDQELLEELIKVFNLNSIVLQLLAPFHERVCQMYVTAIDEFVEKYPLETKLHQFAEITPEEGLPPYAARLAAMTWKEYPTNQLDGFCPFKATERLQQLVDIPDTFVDIKVAVTFPQKPQPIDGPNEFLDIYDRILSLKPKLHEWENYYIKLSHIIDSL